MPALNANVTAFLTKVKNDLTVGSDLTGTGSLRAGAVNYVRAQDIANVLRLLRDAAVAGSFLDTEIADIMGGKNCFTEQSIGNYASNGLVVDAFARLLTYVSGTMPRTVIFSSTALAGTSTTDIALELRGGSLRVDEFRGYRLSVDGVTRTVLRNTAEGVVTLESAITAPSGGEAAIVYLDFDHFSPARPVSYAGGQPAENARLADLIAVTQAAVIAYTP